MFFEFINMKEHWREQAARMMGGYLIQTFLGQKLVTSEVQNLLQIPCFMPDFMLNPMAMPES